MTVVLSKKIAATKAVLSSNNQTSKNTDKSGSNKANVTIRKGRPASTKAKSRRGLLGFFVDNAADKFLLHSVNILSSEVSVFLFLEF